MIKKKRILNFFSTLDFKHSFQVNKINLRINLQLNYSFSVAVRCNHNHEET